jgi:hypothetical protein
MALRMFFSLLFLCLASLAEAQPYYPIKPIPKPQPLRPVTDTYIRGIHYKDHSQNASLAPNSIQGGSWFTISVRSLFFSAPAGQPMRDIRVILQDVATPNPTFGVTAFRLTNITPQGTTLQAFVPNYYQLKNRTYYVTVFSYGALPNHYAYAGTLTVH